MNRIAMRRALLAGTAAVAALAFAAGCSGGDDMSGMNHGSSTATSAPAASSATFDDAA